MKEMKTERGNGYLLVGGKPFYIRGGEIHYFRLKKDQWKDRVKKLKAASMNTVSSYIPWFWHEPEEGRIDLEGKTLPERDIRGFLMVCADMGVKVIARPGPFVNSELREGGYPRWVFEKYPECLSHRRDGKIATGRPIPAEGEPLLRKLVKRWYGYIIPLLAEFSCTKGGPIILCQPDNEISAAWSYGLGNSLYDSSIIKEGGLWHQWLKERYGGLEAISERYGKKIENWADILPPEDMPSNLYEYRRCLDWLNFKREFFADWGITLCRWVKEFGLDVPFFFNEPVAGFYTHGDHPGFMSKMNEAGIDCFTACHNYSDRIYDLEGANLLELAVEITKSAPGNPIPVSVETNHTWFESRLSRNHINGPVNLRMGLAHGLNGSSIYAFTEGRSPEGSTLCVLEYWEDAPVSIEGRLSPCYEEISTFYSFVARWEKEILKTVKIPDLYIGISPAIRYIPFLGVPVQHDREGIPSSSNLEVNVEPAIKKSSSGHEWLDGYEGVDKQTLTPENLLWHDLTEFLILLRRMNIASSIVDLTHPSKEPGSYTLVVPNTGFLEKQAIGYIVSHIEKGGKVLFFNTVPSATCDGYPDSRLAEMLKVSLTDKVRPAGAGVLDYGWRIMYDRENHPVGEPSWIILHSGRFSDVFATFEGKPVIGAVEGMDNRVVVSGISPSFHHSCHLKLWKDVFAFLNIQAQAETYGDYFNVVIRQDRESHSMLLTVCNILGSSSPFKISVREPKITFPVNCKIRLLPCEARMLWINLPVGDNKLVYITHEIIPGRKKGTFEIRGRCGDTLEFAFKKKCKVRLDGKPYNLKHKNNLFTGTYKFQGEKVLLAVSQ